MRMEQSLKSGIDQMRVIFDLCDQDNDGLISAQDFREIGREHFQKPDVSTKKKINSNSLKFFFVLVKKMLCSHGDGFGCYE